MYMLPLVSVRLLVKQENAFKPKILRYRVFP
jgi:hypothetical protein